MNTNVLQGVVVVDSKIVSHGPLCHGCLLGGSHDPENGRSIFRGQCLVGAAR